MNSKLKLLIFGLIPPTKSNHGISGSDVRFINILKNIPSSKFDLTLIGTTNIAKKLKQNKIKFNFTKINSQKSDTNLSTSFIALINIFKLLFILKPKNYLIYSTSDLFWETIPAFLNRKHNHWVQIIHHLYPDWKKRPGSFFNNFFGFYLQQFSLRLIKNAHLIIVINPLVKQKLIKQYHFDPKKIFLSSNGINLNKVTKNPIKYKAVCVGRLDHSKGLNHFVPIWRRVCQIYPQAKLALIGSSSNPDNISSLKSQIKNNHLQQNIDVLGYLDDQKMKHILSSSQIFITPSHEEGWGIAIAEAMFHQLPVVCWNLKNLKSIYQQHIFTAPLNNYSKFSHQIIKLLDKPKTAQRLGQDNTKFIRQFSWRKVALTEFNILSQLQPN